jgi:hypothetical protein
MKCKVKKLLGNSLETLADAASAKKEKNLKSLSLRRKVVARP